MSKDIRSFFQITSKMKENSSTTKTKRKANQLNSAEEDKEATKTSKKKRRIIDSDEEDDSAKQIKTLPTKNPSISKEKKKLVEVDVFNMFSSEPIKRKERVKETKKEAVKSPDLQPDAEPSDSAEPIKRKEKKKQVVQLPDLEPTTAPSVEPVKRKNRVKETETEAVKLSDLQPDAKPSLPAEPVKKKERVKETKKETVKLPDLEPTASPSVAVEPVKRKEHAKETKKEAVKSPDLKPNAAPSVPPEPPNLDHFSFVDKYKPTSIKSIIGQQGATGNAHKLMNWLSRWHINHDGKTKHAKPSPWAKNNDGKAYKAALLSGSPGVGKTTTAHLVCKELMFDIVEFNASDTRSKKLLKEEVAALLSNTSLSGYLTGNETKVSTRHVLIMDEVDGMAGNEDRGGVAELIALIKDSHIPVICMCNDRNHPKIRSLSNHCFDLRFNKPTVNMIRGAMMSICFKEGIKVEAAGLDEIISGTGNDIRQTLNHLALYSASKDVKITTTDAKQNAQSSEKDVKIGQFEVIRKVFSAEEHKKMTFNDKSDLFFHDYNIAPLFVQENYLKVKPNCPSSEIMKRVAMTANSLSLGDLVEKKIRSSQAWSLLPTQAMFSSVLPGEYMEGSFTSAVNFPGWLGKNSRSNKRKRLAQEVHDHTRTCTSGSRLSVRLDYAPFLTQAIVSPLKSKGLEGVPEALKVIKEYHLLREDIDALIELTAWSKAKNPWESVDSKVKAALTRAYNKEIQPYSFSAQANVKKKAKLAKSQEFEEYEQDEDDGLVSAEEEEDDSIENNALIKVKKSVAPKESKAGTSKASSSKAGTSKSNSKPKSSKK